MSFYSYNPHERYRQRSTRRFVATCFSLVFLGAAFYAGFWFGGLDSQKSLYILKEKVRSAEHDRDEIQSDLIKLRAQAQTATVRLEQLKTGYDDLISEGPLQELVGLLRKQVEKGIDMKRLKSVIISARPPQNCSDAMSKRFVVKTPIHQGPASNISLADGGITISGSGVSARSGNKTEAWFDPGKPVEILFTDGAGKVAKKSGVLPLYHTVVLEDREYRFTINSGARSFAKVTYDHCDYP